MTARREKIRKLRALARDGDPTVRRRCHAALTRPDIGAGRGAKPTEG